METGRLGRFLRLRPWSGGAFLIAVFVLVASAGLEALFVVLGAKPYFSQPSSLRFLRQDFWREHRPPYSSPFLLSRWFGGDSYRRFLSSTH